MRANAAFGKLPLSFEANVGQAGQDIKFISRGTGYSLLLRPTDATLMLSRAQPANSPAQAARHAAHYIPQPGASPADGFLRMKLVGGRSSVKLTGLDQLPGKSNYFVGANPADWHTNAPTYSRVKYEEVYPGIDLIYYGNQRRLEYDFHVAPGANPAVIRILFEGSEKIDVDPAGDLAITTSAGEVRQKRPEVYQVANTVKRQIAARYRLIDSHLIGFELGEYDASLPLIIDPVLVYSTYLGGVDADEANAIAVDSDGNAYVTGSTLSSRFPTLRPLQPGLVNRDAFVAKLNPSGNALLYSTYLGGTGDDQGYGIAVDLSGSAYVTGKTSGSFPTTANAFQPDKPGGYDAFVTKLTAAGDALVYSTYLGGDLSKPPNFNPNSGTDIGYGIALDRQGNAYVTGITYCATFPTKKALQPVINSSASNLSLGPADSLPPPLPPLFSDAFVTKINPSGSSLVYSTFLGGVLFDEGRGIAVDSAGRAYITGITTSSDFPTAHNIQQYQGSPSDAFLAKLEPSGREFVYSTFIGGADDDKGYGVAVDSAGNAYVTGETASINFPTTSNAFQSTAGGSPIYKSTDGGNTWKSASSGLPDNSFNALVIDPLSPAILYAAVGDNGKPGAGVFKTTDGGGHWVPINNGFQTPLSTFVTALAIDPRTPTTLFAVSQTMILKTTDGGNRWNSFNPSFPGFFPLSVLIDPLTPTTLYAGSNACPVPAASSNPETVSASEAIHIQSDNVSQAFLSRGLNKSTDGGLSWESTALPDCKSESAAIDPKSSNILYANSFGTVYKSTDGGVSFSNTARPAGLIAIDPINPTTIYQAISSNPSPRVSKSTDGGVSWRDTGLTGISVKALAIDPLNSNTIYAAANNLTINFDFLTSSRSITGFGGGVFKSTDGGSTWSQPTLAGPSIQSLVIDPLNPLTIYAGVFRDWDAFVTKFSPSGSRVYSTLLGGIGHDTGFGIAVDAAGRAFITGETFSGNFPTRDAIQSAKASGVLAPGAFVAMLDTAGSAVVYSTHLGGSGESVNGDSGRGIAVDAFGRAYVAGLTNSKDFPTQTFIQLTSGGGTDAFVTKIAFPPRIASVALVGKNLIVTGENFDAGSVILINGHEVKTRNDESAPGSVLIGKKAKASIPFGEQVFIQVRTSDDQFSFFFIFIR